MEESDRSARARAATAKGLRAAWPLAVLGIVAACAVRPVEEVKLFRTAFTAVNQVGQPLLDELSVSERLRGRAVATNRARRGTAVGDCRPAWQEVGRGGFIYGFCNDDAPYFGELGDPPAAKMMRGALSVIERYAEALGQLGDGGNIEEARGHIEEIGADVAGILSLVPGLQAGAAVIGPALQALQPILEGVGRAASAAEQRRLIREGAPLVSKLIAALRSAAPEIFVTLVDAPRARLTREQAANPDVAAPDLRVIEGYRTTVSNYVILLGELQGAWDSVVAAVDRPADPIRLAQIARRTGEIKGYADSVRRTMAVIRVGGAAR
ncbi:MAG: hypothetical protein JNK67_14935 [Alphaproteobacteria bacterium]|nr:hypothetical protein [Alphaproteobacteria bacterium]